MRRNTKIAILSYLCLIDAVLSGIAPSIPAGGRAEFYLLKNDGSYNYGYDTGSGIHAKQEGTTGNEVQGSYSYNSNGDVINVKYTSGVDGFKPDIPATNTRVAPVSHAPAAPWSSPNTGYNSVVVESFRSANDDESNGDKSYAFGYQSDNHQRQESSDPSGHVKGRYSYTDETGSHTLEYKAGPQSGFEVTGGSLAQPNGLLGKDLSGGAVTKSSWSQHHVSSPSVHSYNGAHTKSSENNDGSYSFQYNTGDSSRQELADPAGNVKGSYSFTNEAGNHDLSYVAGAGTGFKVTGGSLATANGLSEAQNARFASAPAPVSKAAWSVTQAHKAFIQPQAGLAVKTHYDDSQTNDGSYSFAYNTGESSRKESADPAGNVQGHYSFTNEAGNHDLSYVAGSETGFKVTGGSLASPNGLSEEFNLRSSEKFRSQPSSHGAHAGWAAPVTKSSWSQHQQHVSSPSVHAHSAHTKSSENNDGSYAFQYSTGESSRKESADQSGNVQGHYSFTNEAGNHDLSYVAGSGTGFKVTGGSLASANGLSDDFNARSAATWRSNAMTKSHVQHASAPQTYSSSGAGHSGSNSHGAYSFQYDAGNSAHQESGDTSGNVRGAYSYTNDAGSHDLTYVAGPETGFVVTGGSLAKTNELARSSSGHHHATSYSHNTHQATTAIHGSSHGSEQAIAGRSVRLNTESGPIGTKWLPVQENYKTGYYFQH